VLRSFRINGPLLSIAASSNDVGALVAEQPNIDAGPNRASNSRAAGPAFFSSVSVWDSAKFGGGVSTCRLM
jgi:hypothetical protein